MLTNLRLIRRTTLLRLFTGGKHDTGYTRYCQMSTSPETISSSIRQKNLHDTPNVIMRKSNKSGVIIRKNEDLGIATISLKGPTIFNGQLLEAVSSLEEWKEGKGLILHATTPYEFPNSVLFPNGNEIQLQKVLATLQELTRRIRNLPLISVGFLSGKSSGIMTEILLSTDFRLVTEKSELHFNHLKLGLPPMAGGLEFTANIVGASKTIQLFLSNAKVTSSEAIQLGLADKILSSPLPPSSFASSLNTQMEKGVQNTDTRQSHSKKSLWTTKGEINLAENWLQTLVGGCGGGGNEKMNEDASIVQAVKRIFVISPSTSFFSQKSSRREEESDISGKSRSSSDQRKSEEQTREILMDCLHGQPHLTAMGLHTEPMFAHLVQSNRQIHQRHNTNNIMGGNSQDDIIL